MSLVRLYGNVLGHGSLSVVTEGFRSELARHGLLAAVHGLDIPDNEETAGAAAPWGVYTGALSHVREFFLRGMHRRRALMVTPNSTQLPRDLVRIIKGYQSSHRVELMAPSAWAAAVVTEHLGSCRVVPHGVHPAYCVHHEQAEALRSQYVERQFRVIHFSTSNRQRKGTLELIGAWKLFVRRRSIPGATLLCVMDYLAEQRLHEDLVEQEIPLPVGVRITQRGDLGPEAMANNLSHAHVVCQPSRGEGFGLLPLQALASGVPVVATQCTGHTEYLGDAEVQTPGVVVVSTGDPEPIDDLPGSLAPSLTVEAIAHALEAAYLMWPALQLQALEQAPEIQKRWSWEASLASFVEHLKEHP
jgi:glycosyltransferase involved in cell wall biosynthesis